MSREHKPTDATFRMDRRQILSGLASTGLLLGGTRNSFGQARVPVTGGDVAPLPIAIPNFVAGTPGDAEVGAGVSQVITNNLKRSGLFAPIDPAAYHRAHRPISTSRRNSRAGSRSTRRRW